MSNRYVGDRPEPECMPSDTTAPCRQCHTPISETARRCPACGYAPGTSLGGRIVYFLALPWAILFGCIAVASLVAVLTGAVGVGLGIEAFLGTAVFGAIPWWLVVRHRRKRRQPAARQNNG